MDILADEAGLDPAEVRRDQFHPQPEQFPYTTLAGEHYDTGEYEKALDKALEVCRLRRLAQASRPSCASRAAISASAWPPTSKSAASARSRARRCGSSRAATVTVFTGISPHGQGQETTFAQLAADDLGADFERSSSTTATRPTRRRATARWAAAAWRSAARALMISLDKMQREGEADRGAHAGSVGGGHRDRRRHSTRSRACPTEAVTLADIAGAAYCGDLPADIEPGLESTDFFKPADETFPFGTHIARGRGLPRDRRGEDARVCLGRRLRQHHQPEARRRARCTAAWRRASARRCWKRSSTTSNGELLTGDAERLRDAEGATHFPIFETHHTETPT